MMDDAALGQQQEFAEVLIEGLQAGATIKDMKGVSSEMLEGVYAYAHRYYTNGQLDEAEAFFRFLYLYDFYNSEYALGLAAVHQLKREYQKAIDMYAVAYVLTKDDQRAMFHVGQCHLALGKAAVASDCFATVIQRSKEESLIARAQAYRTAIEESAQNGTATDEATQAP